MDDLTAPVIKKAHANYAVKLGEWSVNKWNQHIREDISGPKFEADSMKVLKLIKNVRQLVDDPRANKDLCTKGFMTRTLLTRKTRLPTKYLDDILKSLGPACAGDIMIKQIDAGANKSTIVFYAMR